MFASGTTTMRPQVLFCLRRSYCQNLASSFYDIVISGGGMIGQTMACALSKNPLFKNRSILLIESSPKKDYQTPETYSNRVSSIVPSTKELFVKLGMMENIERYQEVKEMNVWGSYSKDYVNFSHDQENPSLIIENDEIINAAVLENDDSSNVKVIYGKTIQDVKLDPCKNQPLHELVLNDNSSLKTHLVIGADGAKSKIRDAINVVYTHWNYDQFGIVGTLQLPEESENTTAWQKFLPTGPIAILPLKKGLSSLVWSIEEKKAKDLIRFPEEVFVDALNDVLKSDPLDNKLVKYVNDYSEALLRSKYVMEPLFPPHVSSIVTGSRAMFPLSFGFSNMYVKPGVVLIGDAAHKVHPLAGQGVNMGFRDIRILEEKLSQGVVDGRPLGHIRDLGHYESEAQRQNLPIMGAIEMFHRVYTSDSDILKAIGNSCIKVAGSISLVKNIMKEIATN